MKCYNCKKTMVVGGVHTYEDYGNDLTDGIVTNFICINEQCNVEKLLLFQLDKKNNNYEN